MEIIRQFNEQERLESHTNPIQMNGTSCRGRGPWKYARGLRRRDRGNIQGAQTRETKAVELASGEPWDHGSLGGRRGEPWRAAVEELGVSQETGSKTGAGGLERPRK